jgi:peroxiredoxin
MKLKFLYIAAFVIRVSTTSVFSQGIPQTPTDVSPLLIGEKIPALTLPDVSGTSVSLAELVGKRQTVLIFYRGGWCPYCNVHLAELQSIENDVLQAGYQIVALSPDSPEMLKASVEKHTLRYTLLSDSKTEAARAFGLAFRAPEKYGDMLAKASGNGNRAILPVPAVFVLNKKGEILFEYINPDFKKRISGSLLMAVLKEVKE